MEKIKVLVVEDSPTQSQKLVHLLTSHHYDAVMAKNGKEALQIIADVAPDLLISDVMMPEMDGFQLCKALRTQSPYNNLPIILLTTLSQSEDIVNGLECGATYFITKPYDDEFLLKHIKNVLQIHQFRAQDNSQDTILIHDHQHIITATKAQILDLLVSIYEAASLKNEQLLDAQSKLHRLNEDLEKRVDERTHALKKEMIENTKLYEELKIHTEKLQNALDERDEMLKEIYHRVKNNLQVISSLFSLQTETSNDPNIKSVLIQNTARIKSMSLVHELLYQSDNMAKISMKSYAKQLIESLFEIFAVDSDRIKLIDEGIDVNFRVEKAIPCGLVINELISNALKYAFPDNRPGEIHFAFKKSNGSVILEIADNGIGLPKHIDIDDCNTLGLKLVYHLVKQIDGSLVLERDHGTHYKIALPN